MLPSALRSQAKVASVGDVPVLLIRPELVIGDRPPLLIWLHGRTAYKEIDAGRFLRLMRRGFAVCAMDLPGHGARMDLAMQAPNRVLEVIMQAVGELDMVTTAAVDRLGADPDRVAIGGMSAGGMVSAARLCSPHRFAALIMEASSGDWGFLPARQRGGRDQTAMVQASDPIEHLQDWKPVPVLAIHSRLDRWIPFESQWRFLDAIEALGPSSLIERVAYDRTGAQAEHVGFGSCSADAKERVCTFLERRLLTGQGTGAACQ
jgi:poly(3-hydroxybutyrate) depolymerase